MRLTISNVRDIALGLAVTLVLGGAIAAAQQVKTGPPQGALRVDSLEACCAITAINPRTGVITAKVTKTGLVFTLADIPAAVIGKFKVGEGIEMSCAVAPSSGTTGSAATSSGSDPCGSNVPRGADTRPKDCVATSSTGVQTPIACPQGVPIRAAK